MSLRSRDITLCPHASNPRFSSTACQMASTRVHASGVVPFCRNALLFLLSSPAQHRKQEHASSPPPSFKHDMWS